MIRLLMECRHGRSVETDIVRIVSNTDGRKESVIILLDLRRLIINRKIGSTHLLTDSGLMGFALPWVRCCFSGLN